MFGRGYSQGGMAASRAFDEEEARWEKKKEQEKMAQALLEEAGRKYLANEREKKDSISSKKKQPQTRVTIVLGNSFQDLEDHINEELEGLAMQNAQIIDIKYQEYKLRISALIIYKDAT